MTKNIIIIILCFFFQYDVLAQEQSSKSSSFLNQDKWVAVYTGNSSANELLSYDPIVLDSDYYPDLTLLKEQNKQILGYISLGEVEDYRSWYEEAKIRGLLLHENKNWPGSYYVDIRKPEWTEMVINDILPDILHKGFTGIMIDTLDNPIELERYSNTTKYKGIEQATINLIKAIKFHYPNLTIMINRAFEIIPEVGQDIDYVLAESTYYGYNFEKQKPEKVPSERRKRYINLLTKLKKQHPHLEIVTLDYVDPNDIQRVKKVYETQRKLGFNPYVSTVELDKVIKEPKDEK